MTLIYVGHTPPGLERSTQIRHIWDSGVPCINSRWIQTRGLFSAAMMQYPEKPMLKVALFAMKRMPTKLVERCNVPGVKRTFVSCVTIKFESRLLSYKITITIMIGQRVFKLSLHVPCVGNPSSELT